MQKAEIVHTYSNIHKSNSILNWKMGQNKRKNSNFESLKIAIFLSIFKHCEGRMKMLFFASSFLFDFCMTWNFFGNFVVVIFLSRKQLLSLS